MIVSSTYEIKSPLLRKHVQYILFNKCGKAGSRATSFSNANVCLGILKDSELVMGENGSSHNVRKPGINSYLSGFYSRPHRFCSGAPLDEICIDFTPLGFHSFFRFSLQDYILDDILVESFGTGGKFFFEEVFAEVNVQKRGAMIESFLVRQMKSGENRFLKRAIHTMNRGTSVQTVVHALNCSERKLQRDFKDAFNSTPKSFLRMLRFRHALHSIQEASNHVKFSDIAIQSGYFDESHMAKDLKFYTNESAKCLRKRLSSIDNKVLVAI